MPWRQTRMPLTSSGGSAGKLTLTSVPGAHGASISGREHPLRPGLGGGERHRVAHALARIGLAQRDRADAGQRAFHRRRHGARIGHVLGEIGAAVDARQDEVGRRILHDMGERQHHRVGRRAGDREAPLAVPAQPDRLRSGSANGRRPIAPRPARPTQISSDKLARDRLRAPRSRGR